ncbi:MAG TPA: GMC family oxidoreductase [Thermoanaerobaculia bacterium]|nr:GMC family oxidoreductase [Thermoanaerobaculia bacterium]
MPRLSRPVESLRDRYDAVVIGSGYGGGIAASRLARAGRRVCVLERGKEMWPGEYPATPDAFLKELQTGLPGKRIGDPTALYDYRVFKDITVYMACGLGGTSIISSGASLRADPRVFQDPRWPAGFREDPDLDLHYARAEAMLRPAPYPESEPPIRKLAALERSARHLNKPFRRVPVFTNFERFPDGLNPVGVPQQPCIGCGDCESGCNYHAKNTVLMNYLPDAARHGAEIFTRVRVRHLERRGDQWVVHGERLDPGAKAANVTEVAVGSGLIVLGAGTLGTAEILLRSADKGLRLSGTLGRRFSGNGDMVGFSYNTDVAVNGIGFGKNRPEGRERVGPCVAGLVDAREGLPLEEGLILEEGGLPGAIGGFLPAAWAAAALATGVETDTSLRARVRRKLRELDSKLRGPYAGAVRNTQTYLAVGHDDASGRMFLEDDRLVVSWPGVGRQPSFAKAGELMRLATEALGGVYLQNPLWTELAGRNLITGHPMGGCVMADDARDGVVDSAGRVYSGDSGTAVHPGLWVMDAAVIPRSLGVNPGLTIAALAERSCHHLARDHGWTIPYGL